MLDERGYVRPQSPGSLIKPGTGAAHWSPDWEVVMMRTARAPRAVKRRRP